MVMVGSTASSASSASSTTTAADAEPSQRSQNHDVEKNGNPESKLEPSKAVAESDAFLVKYTVNDPFDPKCFNKWYKAWLLFQMSALAFLGSFGSSITSPANTVIGQEFGVEIEVAVLMLALFVLGFAFGPLLWAPISEVYGRKFSILPAMFVLVLFSIGTATSQNIVSILVTRFLGGVFGSAPISNVSAALGDMYGPRTRGVAMAFLAMCVVGGPCVAPLVGAAIVINPHLGWRWTEWVEAILVFVVTALSVFCLPETYGPVLLKRKAKYMRETTGDSRYWHPHEEEKMNLNNIITKHLSRPLRMFFTEPMVTSIALYASFVYGLLFLQLETFPIVFQELRQLPLLVSTVPFLSLFVGVVFAICINIGNQPAYIRAVEKNNGKAVPEARLPPMIIGGVFFSTGLFWFGWTADPSYNIALPIVAAAFIGAGFNIVFQQCLNFLVDVYGPYAASAVSANTILRSIMACAMPIAARPMFLNLGVGPASSVLGGISCLALPVPFIFMRYGLKLRKMSKFAPVDD